MTSRATHGYERLPGRDSGFARSTSLWLGSDHLLLIEIRFWTERYRRIFLRDIQSIVIGRDGRWQIVGVILTIAALLLVAIATGTRGGWRVFWSIAAGCAAVPAAVHILRGPTCRCDLRTPLATVRVRPLGRVRAALRALRIIAARVEQAQGTEARAVIVDTAAVKHEPDLPAPRAAATAPPLRRPGRVLAHGLLCAALVTDATVTTLQWPDGNSVIDMVAVVVFLACVAASIGALMSESGTDLGPWFQRFATTALTVQIGIFVAGWVSYMAEIIRRASAGSPPTSSFHPSLRTIGPIEIAAQSALALWGLVLLIARNRGQRPAWLNLRD